MISDLRMGLGNIAVEAVESEINETKLSAREPSPI